MEEYQWWTEEKVVGLSDRDTWTMKVDLEGWDWEREREREREKERVGEERKRGKRRKEKRVGMVVNVMDWCFSFTVLIE